MGNKLFYQCNDLTSTETTKVQLTIVACIELSAKQGRIQVNLSIAENLLKAAINPLYELLSIVSSIAPAVTVPQVATVILPFIPHVEPTSPANKSSGFIQYLAVVPDPGLGNHKYDVLILIDDVNAASS